MSFRRRTYHVPVSVVKGDDFDDMTPPLTPGQNLTNSEKPVVVAALVPTRVRNVPAEDTGLARIQHTPIPAVDTSATVQMQTDSIPAVAIVSTQASARSSPLPLSKNLPPVVPAEHRSLDRNDSSSSVTKPPVPGSVKERAGVRSGLSAANPAVQLVSDHVVSATDSERREAKAEHSMSNQRAASLPSARHHATQDEELAEALRISLLEHEQAQASDVMLAAAISESVAIAKRTESESPRVLQATFWIDFLGQRSQSLRGDKFKYVVNESKDGKININAQNVQVMVKDGKVFIFGHHMFNVGGQVSPTKEQLFSISYLVVNEHPAVTTEGNLRLQYIKGIKILPLLCARALWCELIPVY
jgi:hypothetical protein